MHGKSNLRLYWIGRAISYKKHEEAGSVGRVRYDKGDLEITVEWYSRDISNGDERRIFKRWARDESIDDPGPEVTITSNPKSPVLLLTSCFPCWQENMTYTFNSTQLRSIDVKMQPVQPVGGVPLEVVRQEARPARAAAQAAIQAVRNIVFAAHRQRAAPPEQLWEAPASEESEILLHCCA